MGRGPDSGRPGMCPRFRLGNRTRRSPCGSSSGRSSGGSESSRALSGNGPGPIRHDWLARRLPGIIAAHAIARRGAASRPVPGPGLDRVSTHRAPGAALIAAFFLRLCCAFRVRWARATVPSAVRPRFALGGFSVGRWLSHGICGELHRGPIVASSPMLAGTGGTLLGEIDVPFGHRDPSARFGPDRGLGCSGNGRHRC